MTNINKNNINKNKSKILFIVILLLDGILNIIKSDFVVYGQLIPLDYEYSARQLHIAVAEYDNDLIKKSEARLFDLLKKYSDFATWDLAKLNSAKIDLQCGNYALAIATIDVFIKERHNSPFIAPACLLSGYIEFEQGNYASSEKYFSSAIKVASVDKKTRDDFAFYDKIEHSSLYWLAVAMSHQGKYLDAVSYFERCYKDYPEGEYCAASVYALGTIAEINFDYDKAIEYYTLIQDDFKYSNVVVASMLRGANDALLLRQPQLAMTYINRAETAVEHIKLQDSIGVLYEQQLYYSNIIENTIYLKGEAYNQIGNFDQTLKTLSDFSKNYPNSSLKNHVYMATAWAFLHKEDFSNAKKYYDSVITNSVAENKTKSMAKLFKSICYKKLGEINEAQSLLSTLAVEPNFIYLSQVLLELGQIYYEKEDYDLARRTLERAEREVDNAKTQVRISSLLAASYLELKQYANAIVSYKKAEQLAKNSTDILIPNRSWYINEARLKQGIALVLNQRSAEAISPLLAYIAETSSMKNNQIDEAQFWLAEAYYNSDMFKNAAETYDRIIQNYTLSKRREDSYYGKGWSYFRQEQFSKSSEVFEKMLKEFPKSKYALEVLTRQGDGFYLVKQYAKAVDCYKRASTLDPNSEDGQYAAYQLAHALYRQNKYEQAITALLNYVKNYSKSPFAPNSLYLIGWIRFQQGKYAEAIDNFNFLIATYPQSRLIPRAYYAIADCYYNKGDYEDAISGYKNIVEQFPSSELAPEAMRSVQYALMALGRDSEAIGIADSYIGSNPESPFIEDFRYKKAEMFYTGRKYSDAIAEFESFSKNFPNSEKNAEALYWMGKSYASMDDFDNAAKYFNSLAVKFPKNDYAALGLLEYALLLKKNNLVDTADAVFQKIIEIYPQHEVAPQAGFERAELSWGRGDTISGIAKFRFVADNYKETDFGDQSRYRIGMYYRKTGQIDAAIAEFLQIAEVYDNPSISADARYRIGELYLRQNNYDKAEESFAIIRDKFAGYEDWYSLGMLGLGEIYEKQNKLDEAKEIYLIISELRPNDEFGKTAKSRLKRFK